MTEHELKIVPAQGDVEDHDRGLLFDLQTLVQRRTVLGLFGDPGHHVDVHHVDLGDQLLRNELGHVRHLGLGVGGSRRDRRPLPGRRLQRP
ncbi:MAG: hypothetical protein WCG47_31260 [Dermatophilaceae bacterium]